MAAVTEIAVVAPAAGAGGGGLSSTAPNINPQTMRDQMAAAAADVKSFVHYAVAFVTMRTTLKLTSTGEPNGSVTNRVSQYIVQSRVAVNMSQKDWHNTSSMMCVCETAAKSYMIESESRPEEWTDREVTCVFEAGPVDPEIAVKTDKKPCMFDVRYVLSDTGMGCRTSVLRLTTDHPLSPATTAFYDRFRELACGHNWKEMKPPRIFAITAVNPANVT